MIVTEWKSIISTIIPLKYLHLPSHILAFAYKYIFCLRQLRHCTITIQECHGIHSQKSTAEHGTLSFVLLNSVFRYLYKSFTHQPGITEVNESAHWIQQGHDFTVMVEFLTTLSASLMLKATVKHHMTWMGATWDQYRELLKLPFTGPDPTEASPTVEQVRIA